MAQNVQVISYSDALKSNQYSVPQAPVHTRYVTPTATPSSTGVLPPKGGSTIKLSQVPTPSEYSTPTNNHQSAVATSNHGSSISLAQMTNNVNNAPIMGPPLKMGGRKNRSYKKSKKSRKSNKSRKSKKSYKSKKSRKYK
jgi:hypothetical protein